MVMGASLVGLVTLRLGNNTVAAAPALDGVRRLRVVGFALSDAALAEAVAALAI